MDNPIQLQLQQYCSLQISILILHVQKRNKVHIRPNDIFI